MRRGRVTTSRASRRRRRASDSRPAGRSIARRDDQPISCPKGQYTSRKARRSASGPAALASPSGCFAVSIRRRASTAAPSGPRALRVLDSTTSALHRSRSSVRTSGRHARNVPGAGSWTTTARKEDPVGRAASVSKRVSPVRTRFSQAGPLPSSPSSPFHVASTSGSHDPAAMCVRNVEKSSAASGASPSPNAWNRAGARSANRPPNAASTASGDPTRPAKASCAAAGLSPSRRMRAKVGSSSTSRRLRSMCCEARCSSAPQSGDRTSGAAPRDLPCDWLALRGARGAGGCISFSCASSRSGASCAEETSRNTVPGARSSSAPTPPRPRSPPTAAPAVSSVTNVPRDPSGARVASRARFCLSAEPPAGSAGSVASESSTIAPSSSESGTSGSSAAAAASSSSSLPLSVAYGASGILVHLPRHCSSQRWLTIFWILVWFALAHLAPSNS